MRAVLYIGDRNYSSWSLRPWLCLVWGNIPFDEQLLDLDQPGYGQRQIADIRAVSPGGTVPALRAGELAIWDSLAIAEWAAEQQPALWPRESAARAVARSITCERHSGFAAIRRDLPMNLRTRPSAASLGPETQLEFDRVMEIWTQTRARYGGSGRYLFGARTIADAFYTPFACRFRTYDVKLPEAAREYADTLLGDDAFVRWERAVLAQPHKKFSRARLDDLYGG